MAPITMDPAVIGSAGQLYGTSRGTADSVMTTLSGVLDANSGCAGSDSAGMAWAGSYDPAAFKAVAAGTNIVNAFGKMHDLLAATSVNHLNTEKSNKQPPEAPDAAPLQLPTAEAPAFNGAAGGDTAEPFGWSLVSSWLQGHTWPNGNPDKLRALGSGWRTAAEGLRTASAATGPAWLSLEDVMSGEMPQVLAQMDLVFTDAETVASQYESLASACVEWAGQIEEAHSKILHILAGALGAGLIIGGIAGFFTLGTGAVAAAGAAGGAAGASIVTVLVGFNGAAAVAVGATAAAGIAAAGVATELQPLLEASPTTFNSSTGSRPGDHAYVSPPKNLQGMPGTRPVDRIGPRYRHTWKDKKGNTYEWDYQHGAVEKYSKSGKHLGEYDAETGAQRKPADPSREPGC